MTTEPGLRSRARAGTIGSMSPIERMLTTRPWTEWSEPVSPVPIALPLPAELGFDAATRARLNEAAAVERRYSAQVRCFHRQDAKLCLRALLLGDPEAALRAITSRPRDGFCECTAETALLVALGPPALRPLLALTTDRAIALDLVDALDTPLALAEILPTLLGSPTYETHHGDQRDFRFRARRWLRRAGPETRALVRRVAGGEVPEELVAFPPRRVREGAIDGLPNVVTCARAALRILGESDAPVLLPIEHAPEDELWPADLELDGRRLSDDERATLTGWLIRTEWCLADNPGLQLAAACSPEGRRAIADSFATRWRATTDNAPEMLLVAIAFGGMEVFRGMVEPSGWIADKFKPRRTLKQATLYRALSEAASSVRGAERDAMLAFLADVAIDGRKKSALWRRIALAELERCAAELGEPADTLDERHLPTLGFDGRGRTEIAYGERALVLSLDASLGLVVEDGTKRRTTLPAARKTDDAKAITAAKARFAGLRTQLRVYAEGAQVRARTWMRNGQRWLRRDFDAVARHPILGAAAQGLVFGEYDASGALRTTFRIAEDRSLAGADDGAISFSDDALVGPVHPGELDDAARTRWAGIFHDYEIIPLVAQLEAPKSLAVDPTDPSRLFFAAPPTFWPHKVDDVSPPEGWVKIDGWNLLDETLPETYDSTTGVFQRWQRAVRGYMVKLEGRRNGFAAKVRREGDYRWQWLRWDEVPPIVPLEIRSDIEDFMPRLG